MFGLSEQTIKDIQSVFSAQPNIDKVLIFGSRAKGTYREGSDIDLALIGNGISLNQRLDILNQLEDQGILYKVDILDYQKQKDTPIGEHINRVGVCFWSR